MISIFFNFLVFHFHMYYMYHLGVLAGTAGYSQVLV